MFPIAKTMRKSPAYVLVAVYLLLLTLVLENLFVIVTPV
jgi:hypothetical protein